MRRAASIRQQGGALLIEVLIAIVIAAFGLLGFVGMQARAVSAEFEALQRSQAIVLLDDMSNRMKANFANATGYLGAGLLGGGAATDCSAAATVAARDLCEWGNLLRGSSEQRAGVLTGSMLGARGCVTRAVDASDRYIVSIAWQGILPTGAPSSACGAGDASFPEEARRRVVYTTVCIGRLRDPAVNPGISRC